MGEEETVEVDTEDEQSSRWEEETNNRLDNTFSLIARKFDDKKPLLFSKITKSTILDVF